MLKQYKEILLFDVETNGLDFNKDHITEFGYVRLIDNKKVEEGSILINWFEKYEDFEIPELIQELTKITPAVLKEKGLPPIAAFEKISELLSTADLLISHNQTFDYNMVKGNMDRYSQFKVKDTADFLDTLLIVGDNKPWSTDSRHKLSDACKAWNVELVNAHRAIDDILATMNLLNAMQYTGVNVLNYVNKWGYYAKHTGYKDPLLAKPSHVSYVPISFGKKTVK